MAKELSQEVDIEEVKERIKHHFQDLFDSQFVY
jgi:hypothetical protein